MISEDTPNSTHQSSLLLGSEEPSLKLEYFLTKHIYFLQDSVSATFSDGTPIFTLTERLRDRVVSVSDIPPIRIVLFKDKYFSLDNRRLRAFKEALIDEIPVVKCHLDNPKINQEFHSKKTNRSSYGGGIVRFKDVDPTEHFSQGPFIFVKRILGLSFEQLKEPLNSLKNIQPLSCDFNSSQDYYDSFLVLILEDARAMLQLGIDAKKAEMFSISFQKYKKPKNPQNPGTLTFSQDPKEKKFLKPHDAFLLECTIDEISLKFIGLSSHTPESSDKMEFKVVIHEDLHHQHMRSLDPGGKWIAKALGSLVTHLRMFDVCVARPELEWLNDLMRGQLSRKTRHIEHIEEYRIDTKDLNEVQRRVVQNFLNLDFGLQLVQGPPGTGKTTMLVSLLKSLASQGRVLVCAPSNKAIQVIAQLFVKEHPEIPAILLGGSKQDNEPKTEMAAIYVADSNIPQFEMLNRIRKALIIFCTLSVSGRRILREIEPVNALIIDEAGQALEAETLIPLGSQSKIKKCLLIGDTNQLPPMIISEEARKYKFNRSLLYRLLVDCQQPYIRLETQYRMHPAIRHWPSKQYYEGGLKDSPNICSGSRKLEPKYADSSSTPPPFIGPYAFINVESQEMKQESSFSNPEEVESIVSLVAYLREKVGLSLSQQLSIITFYRSQVTLIREVLSTKHFLDIKVNTVDSYQGGENDVVIISCVRSNKYGQIGFVADPKRLNVALTRAKHALIILGHAKTLSRSKTDLALLVNDAHERHCFFNYKDIRGQLEVREKRAVEGRSLRGDQSSSSRQYSKPSNQERDSKRARR